MIRGTSIKLQREQKKNTNKKGQTERNKNNKIHMSEKDRRRALDRVREFGIVPAASHPIPSPDRISCNFDD